MHHHKACNGTIYLVARVTRYLPGFHCVSQPDTPLRPEREFFSIAAQPRAAGLRGDPADKLKICLETKSGQVNHTGCWDSSYLQICLESKEDKHHGAH
ncbi:MULTISPECIES: hypothetical protein [Burkholderia]|uniref:hypothetical protein n=1 Tax=Burkholderia TaxID=32008 RepID=UPI00117772F2|nr:MULTISPECIES: hypothetical protein [Burkholderia]EKS9794471.1 hypothetical protein [Burkholderia cepacia]EKS9801728.1 hypothetical protein [Burkholderia cepacia]EKS9811264.1 hypothetical protein [Burkholderia cepacia]EKS9817154.1 hypothetical protein [Burkholderia cepacia]EKS9824659.1 hypothetical protein [Burkholderia cepacia]